VTDTPVEFLCRQELIDDLVEFWHSRHQAEFLDDAAEEWLTTHGFLDPRPLSYKVEEERLPVEVLTYSSRRRELRIRTPRATYSRQMMMPLVRPHLRADEQIVALRWAHPDRNAMQVYLAQTNRNYQGTDAGTIWRRLYSLTFRPGHDEIPDLSSEVSA
jgi:hypothetical protein